MNILYFADIRFPLERANGIQTMETCWALAELDLHVTLIVRPDTHRPQRDPFAFYDRPRLDRLTIEQAPVGSLPVRGRRLGYLAFAAGRALGAGRPDLVMTRDLAVAAMLLRLPGRPPVVYESHGYSPEVAAALPQLLSTAPVPTSRKLSRLARREAYVWAHADGYVTITRGLEVELVGRFGRRPRLAHIPDGVRLEPRIPSPEPQAPSPEPRAVTVAYAGHLYPWKGVDLLVDALARVPNIRGLIIGGHEQEPDRARVQQKAARLGIEDRITLTGQLLPAEVQPRVTAADILALPNPASAISTHATSPLKLFEYMAAGRAIVASDLPAIREVLTHEETALLVPAGDPDGLAAAIRRLAADADLRNRLAGAARAAVAEYSWKRRAERLHALFTEVLAPRE